jgi:LPXTG-site transpeptidase (sortase) family protein
VVARAAADTAVQPTRVRLARLGVDAPVTDVDIDTETGVLDIPKNIQKVGWWQDGAALGEAHGAILLAGHVDSAKDGGGAFYPLKSARKGDTVQVTGDDGRVRSYRVSSIRTVRKSALPASIFSRTGRRRLVLVTCGGPFLPDVGHYRDNVIVTARPV